MNTPMVPGAERLPGHLRSAVDVAQLKPPTRVRGLMVWLVLLALFLFGGLGSWAALAPLRSAVVAPGVFKASGDRRVVQHLEGGIVSEILVRDGEAVEKGDVLLRMKDTRVRAQIGILRGQLASALARDARFDAEVRGLEQLNPPAELVAMIEEDPALASVLASQAEILDANRRIDAGQVAILKERQRQIEEQIAGSAQRVAALRDQLQLVSSDADDLQQLYEKGLVTKARYSNRRQIQLEIMGDLALAESQVQNLMQQRAELAERIVQIRRDRLRAVAAEKQSVQDQIFDLRQRLSAMEEVRERLDVRAPWSGRVVGLDVNTIGEVVESGQKLLEIVPLDEPFIVEAQVKPSDIDEVVTGGEARVQLTAFSFRTTPPIPGRVVNVSADTLTDEATGRSYYTIDVELLAEAGERAGALEIVPGMPAQVIVTTGEQTVLSYILNPILGGLSVGMTESN